MPHDKNGGKLKEGDTVTLTCKVKSLQTSPDYCNCTLETVEPMHPGTTCTTVSVNCKQVEKCEPDDDDQDEAAAG